MDAISMKPQPSDSISDELKSKSRKKPFVSKQQRRETAAFYLFASPWMIGFFIFGLGPILASLALSFTEWNIFLSAKWVGLQNYYQLLFKTPLFWTALGNTAYYALILVPVYTFLSLIIAVLLNQNIILRRWFRTAFYLPSTVPIIAVVMLWVWLLSPQGMVNEFLGMFGIHGPAWFVDSSWIKPSLILMALWGAGSGAVLFLAGLQGIPKHLYEATSLDGASSVRQFFNITMPMLSPIILFNIINGIIGSLQVFTQVYTVGGTSNNATIMMVPYLYNEAFQYFHMGFASAIAWVFFIIIITLTLIVFRWSTKWVYYEGEVRK